jgi:hypothetical protein
MAVDDHDIDGAPERELLEQLGVSGWPDVLDRDALIHDDSRLSLVA